MRRAIGFMGVGALLSGCGVNQEEFERAIKVCEQNGGLKYFYIFPWPEAICKNGIVISNVEKVRN